QRILRVLQQVVQHPGDLHIAPVPKVPQVEGQLHAAKDNWLPDGAVHVKREAQSAQRAVQVTIDPLLVEGNWQERVIRGRSHRDAQAVVTKERIRPREDGRLSW